MAAGWTAARPARASARFGLAIGSAFLATLVGGAALGWLGSVVLVPIQAALVVVALDVPAALVLDRAADPDAQAGSGAPLAMSSALAAWLVVSGTSMAVGTLGVTLYAVNTWHPGVAGTMGFVVAWLFHLWLALESADPRRSILSRRRGTRRLPAGFAAGMVIVVVLAVVTGPAQHVLGTTSLSPGQWLMCLGVSVTLAVLVEAKKALGLVLDGEVERLERSPAPPPPEPAVA